MKQTFLAKIRECEGQIDEFSAVHPISEYAKKMLAMASCDDKEKEAMRRQALKKADSLAVENIIKDWEELLP